MWQKFNKLAPLTMGSFLSATNFLSAADTETRISTLENKVSAISQTDVHGNFGAKYPSTHPDEFRHGLIVSGDLLYWRSDEDGLEYVLKVRNQDAGGGAINFSDAQLKDLHFDWNWGFRAGIGYDLPWDGWDFYINYTHYKNEASASQTEHENRVLVIPFPAEIGNAFQLFTQHAKGKWNLNYNTLDLEIGRNYFLSRALSIRPFFGLRGAWIDQKMHYKYGPRSQFDQFLPIKVNFKNNYHAFGLLAGFNFNWYFDNHWSIFGRAAASALHGEFETKNKYTATPIQASSFQGGIDVKDNFHRVRCNVEAAIGLEWETYFSNNKHRFAVTLGYEYLQWFHQNETKKFLYQPPSGNVGFGTAESYLQNHGNLGLMGGTLAARFDF